MSWRAVGESAVLLEVGSLPAAHRVWAGLRRAALPGVLDLVVGAGTVLVTIDPLRCAPERVLRAAAEADELTPPQPRTVRIPVVYDGADIADVAARSGLSTVDVVRIHSGAEYLVAFLGFAPGFGYLTGLDPALQLPRRDSPRTRVPAGSVAIAGEYTAVYPNATPGGWQLLGHTELSVFDPGADRPALLGPGDRVRFEASEVEAGEFGAGEFEAGEFGAGEFEAGEFGAGEFGAGEFGPANSGRGESALIEVIEPGPRTTVQDGGRTGWAHLGVPVAGPADWLSHALANRLVGNPDGAAALETTLRGPVLRCNSTVSIAVVGAAVRIDGAEVHSGQSLIVASGQTVEIGETSGVRGYLAVAGGVQVDPVLGSRSSDTMAGLGPPALAAGAVLSTMDSGVRTRTLDYTRLPDRSGIVRVVPGPREDWFTTASRQAFYAKPYTAQPDSDRTGVRLSGPRLVRRIDAELPTEGMATGAIQVPPAGDPIVLLANHGPTGGYPVIGVVARADLPLLGQLRPGQGVRFVPVTRELALAAYVELLESLAASIR
jgi:KipI family sensor histidine kinase inhibitor